MKDLTINFKIIILILIVNACGQTSELTDSEKSNISASVKTTLKHYYEDIKKEGLLAEFNYLDSSAEFFWVPPGHKHALNYEAVATIIKRSAPLFSSVNNSFDTLQIIPLSRELATYTGRLTSVMKDTSGIVSTYSLVETGIVVKRKDGWKLLHGQTSVLNGD